MAFQKYACAEIEWTTISDVGIPIQEKRIQTINVLHYPFGFGYSKSGSRADFFKLRDLLTATEKLETASCYRSQPDRHSESLPYSVLPLGHRSQLWHDRRMFPILTALSYLAATWLLADDLRASRAPRLIVRALATAALVLHAYVLITTGVHFGAPNATLFNVLSLSSWIICLVLVGLSWWKNVLAAAVLVFPGTVLWIIAAAAWPLRPAPIAGLEPAMMLHVVTSLLAYGLLATAAMHAMVLAVQEQLLRRKTPQPWMSALPPLTASEALLFRMISAGWGLLSIALGSGLLFVHNLFEQHLVHKTLLSIIAWLIFSALLWGRWRHGWRGRRSLYWTLAGMAALLLAYFGSKLVLELFLGRTWQS